MPGCLRILSLTAVLLSFFTPFSFAGDSRINSTPAQLLAEFHENALALEKKYEGRNIAISGIITRISRDENGYPVMGLVTPAEPSLIDPPTRGREIICRFKEDQVDELVRLKRSEEVIVFCNEITMTESLLTPMGCKLDNKK